MAEATAARSVADALEDVARWREEESGRHQAQAASLDAQIGEIAAQIAALQSNLDALREQRTALDEGAVSAVEEHGRAYDALFGALQEQAQLLAGRSAVYAEAARARDAKHAAALEDPALQKLRSDYEKGEAMLASVPEAYRAALQDAHSKLKATLDEKLAAVKPEAIELTVDPVRIDIVVAVDAIEGAAGVVMAVLPVAESVYSEWADRSDDVQTFVAARAMQALYQVARQLGIDAAQAMYGGHQGLLAVEIEVGRGDPDTLVQAVRDAVDQVLGDAPELGVARVVAYAHPVDVDYLFPPEDGDEEVDDG